MRYMGRYTYKKMRFSQKTVTISGHSMICNYLQAQLGDIVAHMIGSLTHHI